VYTARQWSFIGAPPPGRYPIGRRGRLISQRERWHACAAAPEQAPSAAATRHPPPAIHRRPVSRRPRPFLIVARPDDRSSFSARQSFADAVAQTRSHCCRRHSGGGLCVRACDTAIAYSNTTLLPSSNTHC